MHAIDEEALLSGLSQVVWEPLDKVISGNPRQGDVENRRIVTYKQWMSGGSQPAVSCVNGSIGLGPGQVTVALLKARTGSLPLAVNTGRWRGIPFAARQCDKCATGCVEDLHHVVFECPIYSSVRDKFADLYTECGGVSAAERHHYEADRMRTVVLWHKTSRG